MPPYSIYLRGTMSLYTDFNMKPIEEYEAMRTYYQMSRLYR